MSLNSKLVKEQW